MIRIFSGMYLYLAVMVTINFLSRHTSINVGKQSIPFLLNIRIDERINMGLDNYRMHGKAIYL